MFATFDEQDSGNVSYGVESDAARYFVKTAGNEHGAVTLTFEARVAMLRNAIELARSCAHACLPRLHRVIESPSGPMLVYGWVDGELVRDAMARFRALPAEEIERGLDAIFDLHRELARVGWIASDFYDGSLIYDFATQAMHVIDLDHYHRSAFRNTMGRMFGSTRFMAPEELALGATIDERTTVFTLGRTIEVLMPGSHAEIVRCATEHEPERRYATVGDFVAAWQERT
ncbi:MAG: hypothetical protein QM831_27350 [Kofleriaceae bacterium]